MKYTVSTYRGSMSNFKTMIVLSNNGTFGKDYLEFHLYRENGKLMYIPTDGYKYLDIARPIRDNLKSALNILEGRFSTYKKVS